MTYARPLIAATNGQQPHVSAQYDAASSMSFARLAASLPPRMAITAGSPPSLINRLTNLALGHNATGTPSAAPPSRTEIIKAGNSDACKAKSSRAWRVGHRNPHRPGGFPPAGRAPSCGGPYHPSLPGRRDLIPHSKEAELSPTPLCCFTVSGRAPFQGAGNLIWLSEGFGAATPSRLRKPVSPPIHNPSAFEIHGYDLGHVVVSYPSGKPVRPRLVQHQ